MTDAERKTLIAAAGQELAEALPQAWAIDAYGSFARGEAWPNSDLDLAVLMPPGERLPDRVGLLARLGCDVDLADLRQGGARSGDGSTERRTSATGAPAR